MVYDSEMTNRTFKVGESREQPSLLPARIEDYVGPDNPVRAIESFVCALDLAKLGFRHADRRAEDGQPPYDPADLLKLYLTANQPGQVVAAAGAEACRNLELIWLLKNLRPVSDDRQLPQGELGGAEGGKPQVRAAGSRARACRRSRCCNRRLLLPWRCQQGEHLTRKRLAEQIASWTRRSRLTASP